MSDRQSASGRPALWLSSSLPDWKGPHQRIGCGLGSALSPSLARASSLTWLALRNIACRTQRWISENRPGSSSKAYLRRSLVREIAQTAELFPPTVFLPLGWIRIFLILEPEGKPIDIALERGNSIPGPHQ